MRFVHQSIIPADVGRVFAFHEAPGALERLTPPWERIRVIEQGGSLQPGTRVVIAMRIGPVWKRWEAEHTRYERNVLFQDVQLKGPFKRWVHTHRFLATADGQTRLIDEVEYELPLGALGELVAGSLVRKRLLRMFSHRHAVTRAAFSGPPLSAA